MRATTTFDPLVGLAVPGVALLAFGGVALAGSRRTTANPSPRLDGDERIGRSR